MAYGQLPAVEDAWRRCEGAELHPLRHRVRVRVRVRLMARVRVRIRARG